MFMREAFLLRPYHSPRFASYPEDAKENGERGLYFWGIARESYIGFAYNTKLLPRDAVPTGAGEKKLTTRSLEELLDGAIEYRVLPRRRGQ